MVPPESVLTRPAPPPDAVVRYADHADGIMDLHLPEHPGLRARPVVLLLHGGFWRAAYDRRHTRPLAAALAGEGWAVATPEYRRVGGADDLAGGWPVTFDDVRTALDALPRLLAGVGIPAGPLVLAGHSAGGHLALWLATRAPSRPPVVALAPVGDLRAAASAGLGSGAVPALLGGTPDEVPDRYDAADPAITLRAPHGPVVVLHGVDDDEVPVGNSRGLVARYPDVRLVELEHTEHYALIDPVSEAWPVVRAALREQATGTGSASLAPQ